MQLKTGGIRIDSLQYINLYQIMKRLIKNTLVLVTILGIFYACNPNDTNNTPTADPRDKFVGNWSCNEYSHLNHSNSTFPVTISLDPGNSSQILIANIYQLGASQKAYGIVANTYVNIPNQSVNSCSIKGSGTINSNSNQINWNYYVTSGSDIDTCTAVYTK